MLGWYVPRCSRTVPHSHVSVCSQPLLKRHAQRFWVAVLFSSHIFWRQVLRGTALECTEEEWSSTMALNVTAPWRMAKVQRLAF